MTREKLARLEAFIRSHAGCGEALDELLALMGGEPVAWLAVDESGKHVDMCREVHKEVCKTIWESEGWSVIPLYLHAAPPEPITKKLALEVLFDIHREIPGRCKPPVYGGDHCPCGNYSDEENWEYLWRKAWEPKCMNPDSDNVPCAAPQRDREAIMTLVAAAENLTEACDESGDGVFSADLLEELRMATVAADSILAGEKDDD